MPQIVRLSFCIVGLLVLAAVSARADTQSIAQVKTVRGEAFIVHSGTKAPAKPGDPLYESDVVTTGPSSTIGFTFVDNTVFSAGPDSQIALEQFHFNPDSQKGEMLADISKGSLTVVSGEITHTTPGALKIKTPTSVLAVRGTTFAVRVY
jgi:hypothetical protein